MQASYLLKGYIREHGTVGFTETLSRDVVKTIEQKTCYKLPESMPLGPSEPKKEPYPVACKYFMIPEHGLAVFGRGEYKGFTYEGREGNWEYYVVAVPASELEREHGFDVCSIFSTGDLAEGNFPYPVEDIRNSGRYERLSEYDYRVNLKAREISWQRDNADDAVQRLLEKPGDEWVRKFLLATLARPSRVVICDWSDGKYLVNPLDAIRVAFQVAPPSIRKKLEFSTYEYDYRGGPIMASRERTCFGFHDSRFLRESFVFHPNPDLCSYPNPALPEMAITAQYVDMVMEQLARQRTADARRLEDGNSGLKDAREQLEREYMEAMKPRPPAPAPLQPARKMSWFEKLFG